MSIGLGMALATALFAAGVVSPAGTALSREPDKTLKLYFMHTGEHGVFTFKKNGRYDKAVLKQINHFLRDWRRKEETTMDPHLLDLVWAVYQASGSKDEIHVVCGFRTPQTNGMLRSRSRGVAKHSQHMLGKAMDWFVTDVPLAKLRATAMKMQGGGVGYYPTSGSPFIHTDTGNVRAWPRMSRQQLIALFPNGHTLHLPADGKPLPGYAEAMAQRKSSGTTALAYLEPESSDDDTGSSDGNGVAGWLKRVLPTRPSGAEQAGSDVAAAPEAAPEETDVAAADTTSDTTSDTSSDDDEAVDARLPRARPAHATELAMADPAPVPAPPVAAPAPRQMASLAFAPLPRTRPDPQFLAGSLSDDSSMSAPALALDADDAIAALVGRTPAADGGRADPAKGRVALAFAAAEQQVVVPTARDSAALAQLAAARAGSAAPKAQPRMIVAAAMPSPAPRPAGGVILASSEAATPAPSYRADEGGMQRLIQPPAAYDRSEATLSMPEPTSGTLIAPVAASTVAATQGAPTLPVDRFASAADVGGRKPGFFARLFASLIE